MTKGDFCFNHKKVCLIEKKLPFFSKKNVTFLDTCYKIRRSGKILVFETLIKKLTGILTEIFGESVSPDETKELHEILIQKVEGLPPALMRTICLGWEGDLKDYSELAEVLSMVERKKVTVSAVKKRVERAIEIIKEELKNEYRKEN